MKMSLQKAHDRLIQQGQEHEASQQELRAANILDRFNAKKIDEKKARELFAEIGVEFPDLKKADSKNVASKSNNDQKDAK